MGRHPFVVDLCEPSGHTVELPKPPGYSEHVHDQVRRPPFRAAMAPICAEHTLPHLRSAPAP